MLKKYLYIASIMTLGISNAFAACSVSSTTYSCYAGYYLSGTNCVRCPKIGTNSLGATVYGTTVDKNTGDITSCYAPDGTYIDSTGTFTISGALNTCKYEKLQFIGGGGDIGDIGDLGQL